MKDKVVVRNIRPKSPDKFKIKSVISMNSIFGFLSMNHGECIHKGQCCKKNIRSKSPYMFEIKSIPGMSA